MPFTLAGKSKSPISLEDKIWALRAKQSRSVREVVFEVYKKNNLDIPGAKSVFIILWKWKKEVEERLNKDEPETIELCKKYGIEIEEVKDDGQQPID